LDHLNFYLSAASAYADQASTVFNMFLTVMFGSFGFAAALPLRDIGMHFNVYNFRISLSSICIGISLLAFYVISFVSFNKLVWKGEVLIGAIYAGGGGENLSKEALSAFSLSSREYFGYSLPSIGFIIGAVFGLFVFMWVTNAKRPDKKI